MSTINITPVAAVVGSVTMSRGRKVNLGNYESEDVFLSVTLPVHTGEDYQSVYDQAVAFVQENIEAEVASLGSKSINKVAAKRITKETTAETKVEEKSKPVKTEAEVETEVESEAPNVTEKVKQSDVRQALKDVKDNIGNAEYKAVLAEFDVKAFTTLSEDDYSAVLQACQKLLAEAEEEVVEEVVEETVAEDDDLDDENTEVITLDEFKAACKQYNADNGAGSHKAVLSSAGYTTVNEVPATEYASLMAEMI